MSSSRRSILTGAGALAGSLLAGACGFRPLYGEQAGGAPGVAERLEQVEIANIPNRYGQMLRNMLIDRFYTGEWPAKALYRLDVALSATETKLAIRKDASAIRAQLSINAPFALVALADGTPLFQASSRSLISYTVLEDQYGALATLEDAYRRGLTDVSNDITNRVALFLARRT